METVAKCSWGELIPASSSLNDERIVKLMVALGNAKIGDKKIDWNLLRDFLAKIGVTTSEINQWLQFRAEFQQGHCSRVDQDAILGLGQKIEQKTLNTVVPSCLKLQFCF